VVHLVSKVGAEGPLDRDDVGKATGQEHPVPIRLEIRGVLPEDGRGVVLRVDRDRNRPDLLRSLPRSSRTLAVTPVNRGQMVGQVVKMNWSITGRSSPSKA